MNDIRYLLPSAIRLLLADSRFLSTAYFYLLSAICYPLESVRVQLFHKILPKELNTYSQNANIIDLILLSFLCPVSILYGARL